MPNASSRFAALAAAAIAIAAVALTGTAARAQEIHKWKDAKGVVHYGDPRQAAPGSQPVVIKAPARIAEPAAAAASGASAPATTTAPSDDPAAQHAAKRKQQSFQYGLPPATIEQCAQMAKSFLEPARGTQADRSLFDRIGWTCPNVRFVCTASRSKPGQTSCDPGTPSGSSLLEHREVP